MDSKNNTPGDGAPEKPDQPPQSLPDDLKPLPKPTGLKKLPPSTLQPGGTASNLQRGKKGGKKAGKGGCGCGSLITLAILLIIGVSVGSIAWMIQPFNKAGYAQQRGASIEVTEAPAENTLFLSPKVEISAPATDVEIGAIAASVKLEGTFSEDVYVRAIKVYCAPGTVFQQNLEVIAFEFVNEGTVDGELKGRIVRQKAGTED